MGWILSTVLLPCLALLSACGSNPGRGYERDPLDRYDHYAGPSIDRFEYRGRLDGWRSVGENRLVVWTSADDAYLLTVEPECRGLATTNRIDLSSSSHNVNRGSDSVVVNRERCRITDIHHVNYAKMKHDSREMHDD
jgi:Family of unknown function (DUF6491)